jgi:hypothetical protein
MKFKELCGKFFSTDNQGLRKTFHIFIDYRQCNEWLEQKYLNSEKVTPMLFSITTDYDIDSVVRADFLSADVDRFFVIGRDEIAVVLDGVVAKICGQEV